MNQTSFPTPGSPAVPRANDVYAGIRLLYEPSFEAAFLERRTFAQLFSFTAPCVAFGLLINLITAAAVWWLADLGTADANKVSASLATASFVSFWCGFLVWSLRRRKIGIASWQVVIDDRSGAAGTAVDMLRAELRRRLQGVAVTQSEQRRRGRYAVRVRYRTFSSYVSVFPFGSDLFVGWAMLEEPTFWNVLGGWLGDVFRGSGWFRRELRSYQPKALRDCIHNATREAVGAAAASQPLPMPSPTADGRVQAGAGARSWDVYADEGP
jgi:hypothetical protein